MGEKLLITSALPYCNNVPHLGNIIGSTLSGDIYARFKKLTGHDVLYLCGTDDYGTTTEVKAIQEGLSCQEICKKYGELHKNIYDWFDINFDAWGKTSTEIQTKITHEIFLNLYKNGFIEEKTLTQMYCQNCDRFLADRYLKGVCYHNECTGKNNITNGDQCDACQKMIDVNKLINPFCYLCKNTPFLKETNHLYLKLGDLSQAIENYNFNNDKVRIPDIVKSVIKSWLDCGLESRCITRDLKWGTPVPWEYDEVLSKYKNKVFYVWFDAPFGYYSILQNSITNYQEWFNKDIKWVQCYSKDNIPFHTIIFPGCIIGSGMNLPSFTDICHTEYLLYEGEKFSKSNNIGIFGDHVQLISSKLGITSDYWRYYLTKIRPEAHDSSFDWNHFINTINADLVNNIGNFINRCISMSNKYCDNSTKYYYVDELLVRVKPLVRDYINLFNNFKFKDALNQCLQLGALGNQFLQSEKPWVLAKDKNNKDRIEIILGQANMIIYVLIRMLEPFMPEISNNLKKVIVVTDEDPQDIDLQDDLFFGIYMMTRNMNIIRINQEQYKLPFKNLLKEDVKKILSDMEIKSTFEI